MAKKETKGDPLSLDEYDFGSEFDFDEFNMEPKPVKSKREAVERVASAALEGATDAVKSPSFFRDMIRKALPRGYGNMLDIADQTASTIRGLYNDGAKEVKPALKETAKVLDRLMPANSKHLPKGAENLLKKFIEANKDKPQVGVGGQSAMDMAVAGLLQDTFKFNATEQARREAKADAQQGIQDAIANDRHQDQIGQLEGIRKSVVSMAAYQKRIEFSFQKKSLELQARQYFVAVNMLNEQKRQNLKTTEMLSGILNNTALPDLLKLRTSEKFKDMLKNKAMAGLQDGIFGQRDNFFQRMGAAFKEQAMGSIREMAQGIRDGAAGVEMAQDSAEMASDMGMDRYRMMGNVLGSEGAKWIGSMGAGRLSKVIDKKSGGRLGKFTKGIRKLGNKLQFGAENAPQILTDWSNTATDVDDKARQYLDRTNLSSGTKGALAGVAGFIGNPIADLLKGTVRRANAQDTKVKSTGIGDMHTPMAFNNQAHRSLVEVIPGYLARILQEQQIARTGNTSIDLVQYDFGRGAFSTTKAVRTAIFNKLVDEKSKGYVKDEQSRLLEMVDPMGKLSPEQRAELGKILMNDNLRGRPGYETGRITNYLHEGNFGESKHGKTYAKLFQSLNDKRKANGENDLDVDFAARFRNTGRSISERRGEIQQLLEIYPRETLEDMGLIKPGSDEIDMAQLHRYFGGEEYKAKGVQVQGGMRRLGRDRGRGAPQSSSLPQLGTDHTADNPVVAEIQKLIGVIEAQSSKPLVAEIKTILEALKDELGQGGSHGPSRMDQFMDVAADAGHAARRAATRARRKAQVQAGRFAQQNQGRLDAVRQAGQDFLTDAQRKALRARRMAQVQAGRLRQQHQGHFDQASNFMDAQLQRGQELWNDRPSLEQLRDMLTERLGQARTAAGAAFGDLRQRSQGVGARILQSMEAGRKNLNERLQGDGLKQTNSLLGEIKETLLGIQARLDDGILTMDASGVPRQGLLRRAGGAARRGFSRLNMRISDMVGLGFNAIKKTAQLGGSAANWLVGGTIRGAFRAGIGAAKFAGDMGSRAAGNAYRRARGFVDIYVGNERKPRIYGRLMQEGNIYFNQETGKPVRHFKDITGTVVKRGPNGDEVVLEDEEIKDAYQRQGPVKKTLKALGVVAKSAYGVGKKLTDIVLGGIPPVYRMAMWGVKKAWGLLDLPQDIFVKDQLDSPAMTARIMRAGGYRSAVTGNVISKPSQIDGPVLSGDETVLTHDDIRKGLVDRNNKPIRTGLSKLLHFAFGGFKKAGQLAWKAGKLVNKVGTDLVKGGIGLGKKLVKGGIAVGGGAFDLLRGRNPFQRGVQDADIQTVQVAAESNSLLKEIRDLLRDRLPEKKKHADQDTDGDGIRDGSYEDQMKKKAEADKAKAEKAEEQAKGKPGVGGEPGMLAKLWAKLRGKKTEEDGDGEDGGDTNIDIGGGAGREAAKDAKRARRLARLPGGSWKTSKGFLGKAKFLGTKGWGLAKGAGKIGMSLLGLEGLGLGGMVAGAGSAIAAGASAVGGALATGAAAVAGAISLPVILGAAAVAAVGVGAYYGYKYLTRKKLGLLSKIRYAQYGFFPTDTDHVNAVFGLEDKLKDAIIYGKEGAKLDAKRVDPKSLIKDFDIDEDDKGALNKWLTWFSTRFKPVFLTHVSALKGIAANKWLADVDDLDPPVATQYLNATRFPEGPYGQDTSPFKDLKSLPAGAGDVRELIKIAETELQKKTKDSAGKAGVGGAVAATAATAAAGAGAATPSQPAQVGTTPSGISKQVLTQAAAAAGAAPTAPAGAQVGVAGSSTVLNSLGTNRLDGIDVVRMKTYGLVKMEVDKVRALLALEKSVRDSVTYNKNVAAWSGSLEHILTVNGPAFGVDISDEALSANWLSWFNQRFLPVYLNYATLMKAQTGKDNPDDGKISLKPTQIVDVATGIFTTTGNRGSVWNVSTSPWEGYELNVDVRSTDGNMQGLKENAKNAIISEPGGKAANQPTANKSAANTTPSSTPKVGGLLGMAWGGLKSMAQGATDAVKSAFSSGPPVGGKSDMPGGMGGGREIAQPGKGTAGDINAIPKPTGNRSWGALKDTILAAAKMVGVDGKLMAAMAAIESGFDHMVKAGTSSATGLYQFISDTWNSMLKKYGGKYGIAPGTPPTDARANALMGAEYIKDNMAALEGKIGRPLTDTDVYFAHFLGSAGAKKFLTADPNAIGASILPQAASANRGIFYDRNGAPLTVGQIYQLVNNRVQNKAKGFGINDGGEEMVDGSKSTGSKASGEVPPAAGGKAAPAVAGNDQAPKAGQPNTAAPKTSSFGVGSTAPATVATNPAPQAAPATTDSASTGPVNRGVPIGAMASGFAPPRPMQDQVNALRQMNEVRVSNLADTNKLLEESVDIQGQMLTALNGINERLGQMASLSSGANGKPTDNVTPSSQASRAAPQRTAELPKPPVSVARPRAPY